MRVLLCYNAGIMKITKRQQIILDELRLRGGLSSKDLLASLAKANLAVSEDSLVRDLDRLKELGFQQSSGRGPARRHSLSDQGWLLSPLDMTTFDSYLALPRPSIRYDRQVLSRLFSVPLFDAAEISQLAEMQKAFTSFMQDMDNQSRERWYQKWLIEFAWKSSSIEGNTYSILETETLLIDHIEAAGKSHAEAQMILNHQTAVRFSDDNPQTFIAPDLGVIEHTHRLLVEELNVASGLRKHSVGISGSAYTPIGNESRIKEELRWLLEQTGAARDAWAKALSLLIALSYMQAFADGNKRTARVVANGILRAHKAPPLIFATIDPTTYRRACLAFYELGSLDPIKQAALDSWRQTVDQVGSS